MFFYLSKILWFAIAPSSFLVLLTLAAAAIAWMGPARLRRRSRRVALISTFGLAIAGFSPLGSLLFAPLENRFPRPDLSGPEPSGIIVLGGAIDAEVGAARGDVHIGDGADRLTTAVILARRFPNARLIFTGGSNAVFSAPGSESADAMRLWIGLGVAPERIRVEDRSRNTYENAEFTRNLLHPNGNERYILVTSAYHMPRSVGLFRKAGFGVVPYPVDYHTTGTLADLKPMREASGNLRTLDIAAREWIGLVAYRVTGKIDALLPAP